MKNLKNQSIKYFLIVLILITPLVSFSQDEFEKVLPIKEAIKKGLIELKITGAYDSQIYEEIIDLDGVHFGKCMAIVLKSNTDSMISVRIDCGMELIPFDSSFQTMIVTKTVELPLYPRQIYTTRFYAMCGQIHDNAPYIETIYRIGGLANKNTVRLAKYFEKNLIQNMAGQHALWAYTDNVTFQELKKYGADSLTISFSSKILEDLSIKTRINTKKKSKKISFNNSVRLDFYILYIIGTVFLVIFFLMLFFYFKSRAIQKQ